MTSPIVIVACNAVASAQLLLQSGIGNEHVKILAKISRLLHGSDFRDRLRKAKTAAEVLETIRDFESN